MSPIYTESDISEMQALLFFFLIYLIQQGNKGSVLIGVQHLVLLGCGGGMGADLE